MRRESPRRPRSVKRRRHDWQPIASGRVCQRCLTAQMTGEFDDAVSCDPHES